MYILKNHIYKRFCFVYFFHRFLKDRINILEVNMYTLSSQFHIIFHVLGVLAYSKVDRNNTDRMAIS